MEMTTNQRPNAGVLPDENPPGIGEQDGRKRRKARALLWTIQGLLALLFLFAGVMKLVMPIEMLTKDTTLPGLFLRFIGVAEVLGALGLILPGLLRIRPGLTPFAAAGLASPRRRGR